MLVRKINVNEKYALQEIDGKLNDLFYKDIESMDKLAYPMLFCLYKYGCMVLSRFVEFKSPTPFVCNINYVFYDKNHPNYLNNASTILKSKFENINLKATPPDEASGFANESNIVIYLSLDRDYLPFGISVSLEKDSLKLSSSDSKQVIADISDKYINNMVEDCLINAFLFNSINEKSIVDKFKGAIEELDTYYSPSTKKQKKQLPLTSSEKKSKLNTLKHELTHVYDFYTGVSNKNFFTFIKQDAIIPSDKEVDTSKLKLADYILYFLWSKTEFNAYTTTYGYTIDPSKKGSPRKLKDIENPARNLNIGRPISGNKYYSISDHYKYLESYIETLSRYNNEEFWEYVKDLVVNGNNEQTTKTRIKKMSNKEFKTYFIKTSKKLLDKFKEKTIKNSTQQSLYNKDSKLLAQEVRKAIDENISKGTYGKNKPFLFTMSFPYYFKKESSSYKVLFSIDVNTDKYFDNISNFSANAVITIRCKRINIDFRLSSFLIMELESFYHLYQELVTKQRKSYLDKISIEIADDLRYLLDKKISK